MHTFPYFKTLVDKAITLENERRSLEDFRKRKRDQSTFARNHNSKTEFQKGGTHKPRRIIHAQSRISMQETRSSHIAQALLVTLVEKKGTMPSSAPSQGTRPQSRTTVAIIQRPSGTISTPITTTGRVIWTMWPKRKHRTPQISYSVRTLSTQYLPRFCLILELLTHSFRRVLLCKIIFRRFPWKNPWSSSPLELSKWPRVTVKVWLLNFKDWSFTPTLLYWEAKGWMSS